MTFLLFAWKDFLLPSMALAQSFVSSPLPFNLNKRLRKLFAPVVLITFAILLSTFSLTKAGLTLTIQQNRRSVDQSRSKKMVLSMLHCQPCFESFRVRLQTMCLRASQTHS